MEKYRFEIGLFVLYSLLALMFTWPLALNLNNSIYGVRGDHFVQLWESWWRKDALLSGESLTFTPLIYAPNGFDFSSFPIQPLPTILNLGLTLLTNEVLALNILLLLSFPLAGLAVYLLVKRLTQDKLASAFSGLVYAFSMYHFSHAWEHSTLISIYWMPFYVLALVNFGEKKNVKSAVVAALLFAAVLLDNFYYGYMMAIFSAFFFLFQAHKWFNRRSLRRIFLFFVLCSLFSILCLLPILRGIFFGDGGEAASGQVYSRSLHDLNWFAARPWHYLLPSTYHPLWGRVSKSILSWIAAKPPEYLMKPYARVEHNLFLGLTALTLSVIAVYTVLKRPKEKSQISNLKSQTYIRLFLFLGIAMMIFSAPPMVTIFGFKVYFPSHFLYKVFPMFSAYARFGVLVLLCTSVLAGFGLKFLLEKIKNKKLLFIVYCSLFIFVLLEVLLPSFNVDLTPPEAYQWLKDQPSDPIVVEFPPQTDHSGLLYQRVHGKRLFNPTVENPQDILHAPEDQVSPQALLYRDIREFPEKFSALGVKYVIFHEGDPFLPFNFDYFGGESFKRVKVFSDMAIYEVVETR